MPPCAFMLSIVRPHIICCSIRLYVLSFMHTHLFVLICPAEAVKKRYFSPAHKNPFNITSLNIWKKYTFRITNSSVNSNELSPIARVKELSNKFTIVLSVKASGFNSLKLFPTFLFNNSTKLALLSFINLFASP